MQENIQTAIFPGEVTAEKFVDMVARAAFLCGLPLACWKLPGSTERHLIVDFSDDLPLARPDVENAAPGFLVAPFDNGEGKSWFVRAGLHLKYNHGEVAEKYLPLTWGGAEWQKKQEFNRVLQGLCRGSKQNAGWHTPHKVVTSPKQAHYESITRHAIEQIKAGHMQKVVLSRNKKIALPRGFAVPDCFRRLCGAYPGAFVSLVSLPGAGTWMGASPEMLISIDRHRIFRTVSLAGTQALSKFASISEASWRQKEIEEQAMVSRYIINCFKKIRLREFEESGPRTIQAGSLLHLQTDFRVDMQAVNFSQLGSVMLELLHPTSAVCGMPRQTALDFILKYENYQRALYSGFLGPVNIEAETHVFVNLRCMQLMNNEAVLYAGAGITADSDPESEFLETEMKMEVMRKYL